MPTYTYTCDLCKHTIEYQHAIDLNPDLECPRCPAYTKMRRIPSVPAVTFKGNGWGSDKKGPTK